MKILDTFKSIGICILFGFIPWTLLNILIELTHPPIPIDAWILWLFSGIMLSSFFLIAEFTWIISKKHVEG